jgi:isoquinoline 1-oxidoreductase subunit beta
MNAIFENSRRDFLKTSALAGGGLLVGFVVPGAARLAHAAAADFKPNAFIRITPDNQVTVVCAQSEMGQGVLTAIPMLVAEELEADWSTIRVEQAPSNPAYGNPHPAFGGLQATGGSASVRGFWEPMRKAGATAREMLIGAAADTWKVDRAECHAEKGMVVHKSGKKLSYGQLAAAAATQPVPANVALKDPKSFKIVGKPAKRLDTPLKVNGKAVYGMDVRVPGMLTAVVARAPVTGAKVASFNADKVKAMPGVKHVVQIGSGVAVVADNYWNAKKGRDALEVKWEDGAGASLSSESLRKTFGELAEKPGTVAVKKGDVGTALAGGSGKKLEAVYEVPYLAHACMEPMNCTAMVKPDGVEVWGSVQSPGLLQIVLSQVAGVKPEQVQVTTTMLGGGFGRRFGFDFAIDAVLASKAVGAPVHVVYPREDDIRAQHYRPASLAKFQAVLDAAGNPVAARVHAVNSSIADAAHMPYEANGLALLKGVDGFSVEGLTEWPYATDNLQVEWTKNEPPVGVWFWRSVGHSQNIFFVEGFVDEMAVAAGKDPYEYRRALLGNNPRYKVVLELAAQKAGWGKALPAGRGRGIAVGQSFGSYVAEVAEVSVGKDGKVKVHRVVCAVDCGRTVNPDIIKRQMESSIVFGLSAALYGEITFKDGKVDQSNFHDYEVLRMSEMPVVEVHIVPSTEAPGGVGEPGLPPAAPALVNAIYAATGKRLRKLPLKTV